MWNERHCLYGEQFFCICKVNIWVSFHHYLGTDLLEPICFAGIQESIQSGLSMSRRCRSWLECLPSSMQVWVAGSNPNVVHCLLGLGVTGVL